MKVKSAIAIYTGGGIYWYSGLLSDGNHFLTFTDWEGYVMLLDADPATDEAYDICELTWQEEHTVGELVGEEADSVLLEAMKWIIDHEPKDGNYNVHDIAKAMEKLEDSI